MMRRLVMAAALVGPMVTPVGAAQGQGACCAEQRPTPVVAVQGNGEVQLTPDRAMIVFAVETRGQTAQLAGQANARRQKAVIDTLKAMGIPAERISTVGFEIAPEMVYPGQGQPPRVSGYVARNGVQVEVRDRIDDLGRFIDAALAKEANRVSALRFTSSRTEEARREALAKAVERARADAEVMAKAAGGTLGVLLDLQSHQGFGPVYKEASMGTMLAARTMDAAPTPVEAGSMSVSASVTARWEFKPAK